MLHSAMLDVLFSYTLLIMIILGFSKVNGTTLLISILGRTARNIKDSLIRTFQSALKLCGVLCICVDYVTSFIVLGPLEVMLVQYSYSL